VAYPTANRSEGKLNFKKLQQGQSCITSLLTVLNHFIKNRLTAKSNKLTSDFGKKKHSRPYMYSKISMHLHLTSSINTLSVSVGLLIISALGLWLHAAW